MNALKEDSPKSANSKESRIKKDNSYKLWAAGLTLLVVIIIFYHRIYFTGDFPITSLEELAQLGDSYGMWSSLFSGLAFAGVVATFVMQRKTLDAQMEELALSREEFKKQVDALKGQEEVMNQQLESIQLQSFENTLNKLIELKAEALRKDLYLNSDVATPLDSVIIDLFSDSKYTENLFLVEECIEFSIYLNRVLLIIKLIKHNNKINGARFFIELALSSFRKEEFKIILCVINRDSYREYAPQFYELFRGLDVFSMFKKDFDHSEINDQVETKFFELFIHDDFIIDVILNYIDHTNKDLDCKYDVLDYYIECLEGEIFGLELFGDEYFKGTSNNDDKYKIDHLNNRISEIKEKRSTFSVQ